MSGRPRKTAQAAAREAVKVIHTAHALRYNPSALKRMGFANEQEAAAYVFKRRRGLVGDLVGDTVRDLFPAENRIQVAVSLVLDHEVTSYRAARMAGCDLTNLKRALAAGKSQREAAKARALALKTQVTNVTA